jgi:hypothetical protein
MANLLPHLGIKASEVSSQPLTIGQVTPVLANVADLLKTTVLNNEMKKDQESGLIGPHLPMNKDSSLGMLPNSYFILTENVLYNRGLVLDAYSSGYLKGCQRNQTLARLTQPLFNIGHSELLPI